MNFASLSLYLSDFMELESMKDLDPGYLLLLELCKQISLKELTVLLIKDTQWRKIT